MKTFIRAAECWIPSNDRSILAFGGGHYGSAPRLANASHSLCFGRGVGFCESEGLLGSLPTGIARGEGAVGQVFLTGIPAVHSAGPASAKVAFPVLRQGRLMAVLALHL